MTNSNINIDMNNGANTGIGQTAAQPNLQSPVTQQALEKHLTAVFRAEKVRITAVDKLGGGAIQENWAIDVEIAGGSRSGRHQWVLRTDSPSGIAASWSRKQEFAILKTVFAAGVLVPEPIHLATDSTILGRYFYLMQRVGGEARGHKLTRDAAILAHGDRIVAEIGAQLATLHRIEPPVKALDFMPRPEIHPALARIEELYRFMGQHDEKRPVLVYALRWLASNMVASDRVCLAHGDLRTGNYLVQDGRLSAILDWEFAGFSDPLEDLGWMLARCWRFGQWSNEAGGLGSAEALLQAYEKVACAPVPRNRIPYWQLMATVRWAVIALDQAARAYDQGEKSLELALTSEVVPSLEWDCLDLIDQLENEGQT